MILQGRL